MTRSLVIALAWFAARELRRSARGPWLLIVMAATAPVGCADRRAERSDVAAVGRIVRVVDGDTIVVRTGESRVSVRLLGIDTPELHRGAAECGARAARRSLARLAPAGSRVQLQTEPGTGDTHDRYGRLLAYVDGRRGDLGERQLRAGAAYVYRYRGRRLGRLDRYRRAQNAAREHRRGAWSRCAGDFHSARAGRQPRPLQTDRTR